MSGAPVEPDAERDVSIVSAQLGRELLATPTVVARCGLGLPVVVRVPPVTHAGEPFPTRYWLVCPLAHRRVARLESRGDVTRHEARLEDDPVFRAAMEAAHADYAAERDRDIPSDATLRPRGGVAGIRAGVKCLHAHLAHSLGGGENPCGAEVAAEVLPLDCERPCVSFADGAARRDPAWREPRSPD